MYKRFFKYSGLLLMACFVLAACKKLDDINRNPNKPSTSEPAYLLTGAEKKVMDNLYSNLSNGFIGMHYAQYWSSGNVNKIPDSQYALDPLNNAGLWNNLYAALYNLDRIVQINNEKGNNPAAVNQHAIAAILKVWIYQILTDAYVNVPFTEALKGNEKITPKYDDARTIYNSLVDTLQEQIGKLDPAQPTFDAGDVIYNGNVDAWKKLAHSLLLRLAIRMADADPAKAKSIIEANYQQAMTSNADNAQFKYLAEVPNQFPYNESQKPITDFFVSATMVDYMRSVNDPRLPIYARPNKGGNFNGMPYGASQSDPSVGPAENYSYPGTLMYSPTMPGILMNYDEVAFILAEAAARGFSVGADAATHYNNAVTASLQYWGVTSGINEYLAKVPYTAGDWRNVIGTQKWLALYMQGFQGWFERLRLDFKKPDGKDLFIAPKGGSLDPNAPFVPFRLTYPSGEQTQNTVNYEAAASAIGGDTKGVKNWWDKN